MFILIPTCSTLLSININGHSQCLFSVLKIQDLHIAFLCFSQCSLVMASYTCSFTFYNFFCITFYKSLLKTASYFLTYSHSHRSLLCHRYIILTVFELFFQCFVSTPFSGRVLWYTILKNKDKLYIKIPQTNRAKIQYMPL